MITPCVPENVSKFNSLYDDVRAVSVHVRGSTNFLSETHLGGQAWTKPDIYRVPGRSASSRISVYWRR